MASPSRRTWGAAVASNGGENKASVVDLKTLETITKLDTGGNPDGLCYESGQHEVYLFNGRAIRRRS